MVVKLKTLFIVAALAITLSGCGASMLEPSDFAQPSYFSIDEASQIPDEDPHVEILRTVQKYRDAMAQKDVATLRSMISKEYYENASTTDDLTDDYGNERLDEIFNDYLVQSVKDIRFIIQIKQLTHEGMEYYVDYQYIWNFRYEVAGQSYWQSKNDTNRMTLVKEDGAWKIRGGL